MKAILTCILALACILIAVPSARAQRAPEAGYVFPPGGKAGTTVEVRLGGYDWTPDMDYFTHDPRVKLIPSGPPGPILIPQPPYWFGAKGRLASMPIPRETAAKLVIAADVAPGPLYWQAANANGVTSAHAFIVGAGLEVIEEESRKDAQLLASLPVTVSGRIMKNEEVDRYRFIAPKDGPITCELMARRLGAKFLGMLEVRDGKGQLIVDIAGTSGNDPILTFAAKAKEEYVVSVWDVDFGGDRSYVYRLTITDSPRVVGAVPAAGRRGETRDVEFLAEAGTGKLESVKRKVTFPATGATFEYRLETTWGTAVPFPMLLSDLHESVGLPRPIQPVGITGVLEQADTEERYFFGWKKGEIWSLSLEARRIGSPLDVALAILGPDGKELARNDDLPDTTDAGLDFTVPADGTYSVMVSDMAGKSGARTAIYRLVVRPQESDFKLHVPAQRISVPIGGKFDLPVKAIRTGGFKGPIALTVKGLPAGVTAPPNLTIPADKTDLVVSLEAGKDTGTAAALVTVEGTSGALTRTAVAKTTHNLSPRGPEENQVSVLMLAATMKPRFKGQPVDQDTGRKVYRGTTFPADVIVERMEGFGGEITLQMAAIQSYAHQGITGGEVKVPPGVTKAIYPVYMPEWLETTRTSRMGMVAVAQVPDPKGKVRYLLNDITGFITMTLEGALLKVSSDDHDMTAPAGRPFDVRVKVARLAKLAEPVRLELRLPDEAAGRFKMEPIVVPVMQEDAVVRIIPAMDLRGLHTFTLRATAMQDGRYPVISEAHVTVELLPAAPPR